MKAREWKGEEQGGREEESHKGGQARERAVRLHLRELNFQKNKNTAAPRMLGALRHELDKEAKLFVSIHCIFSLLQGRVRL